MLRIIGFCDLTKMMRNQTGNDTDKELTEQGLLKIDNSQQTNIPGVYACGDNSAFRSIATAVSTGSQAGAAINMALSTEIFNYK